MESDGLLLKHRDKIVIAAFNKDVDVQPSALSSTMVRVALSLVFSRFFSLFLFYVFQFPAKKTGTPPPACAVASLARDLIGLLQVRRYVAAGRSIKYFVADEVLQIIERDNLFKDGDQQSSSY